jgi:hypothetical protein
MTCATYGVAVTVFLNGQIKQTHLVLGPKIDFPHLVYTGDEEFARTLCDRMRRAWSKSPISNGESIYAVVPLPVTAEQEVL